MSDNHEPNKAVLLLNDANGGTAALKEDVDGSLYFGCALQTDDDYGFNVRVLAPFIAKSRIRELGQSLIELADKKDW